MHYVFNTFNINKAGRNLLSIQDVFFELERRFGSYGKAVNTMKLKYGITVRKKVICKS